jgi:hypothetical protein
MAYRFHPAQTEIAYRPHAEMSRAGGTQAPLRNAKRGAKFAKSRHPMRVCLARVLEAGHQAVVTFPSFPALRARDAIR